MSLIDLAPAYSRVRSSTQDHPQSSGARSDFANSSPRERSREPRPQPWIATLAQEIDGILGKRGCATVDDIQTAYALTILATSGLNDTTDQPIVLARTDLMDAITRSFWALEIRAALLQLFIAVAATQPEGRRSLLRSHTGTSKLIQARVPSELGSETAKALTRMHRLLARPDCKDEDGWYTESVAYMPPGQRPRTHINISPRLVISAGAVDTPPSSTGDIDDIIHVLTPTELVQRVCSTAPIAPGTTLTVVADPQMRMAAMIGEAIAAALYERWDTIIIAAPRPINLRPISEILTSHGLRTQIAVAAAGPGTR